MAEDELMKIAVGVQPPYLVHLESGILERLGAFIPPSRLALITDENVAQHHAGRVQETLERAGKRVTVYVVPPGEDSKTLRVYGEVLQRLARDGFDRGAAVVSLGGGMVSDLAGFVGASFMRGLDMYSCPTTLLGMVDASVGGKTGINLPEGKNLVGAFWQPKAVFMDVLTLRTLPEHAFRQGAVELFKTGLIADESILQDVQSDEFGPDGSEAFLNSIIGRSVAVKSGVVARDERESGERAHLNLGHTLAHALEAYSEHRLSHGDAVAYGLVFAMKLSAARGFDDQTQRTETFLRWVQPAPLGVSSFEALEPFIKRDKKHQQGRQRWVLLKQVGEPVLVDDVTDDELRTAWEYLLEVAG
jgi:3-dehydroquinate synthase